MGIRNARFVPVKPENIEYTLEVTMPLKDWQALQKQLKDEWPSWELSSHITDMVYQANKTFWSDVDPDKKDEQNQ